MATMCLTGLRAESQAPCLPSMDRRVRALSRITLGLLLAGMCLLAAAPAQAAAKPGPAVTVDGHKTRLFLPMRHPKVTKRVSRVSNWSMEAQGDISTAFALDRDMHRGALHHLRVHTFENRTFVQAEWRFAAPVEVETLPNGIAVTFYHQKATPVFRTVTRGVQVWEGQRWTSQGPMRIRALALDPREVRLEPAIASAGSKRMGLSRVSQFGRWHGAIAAVNGSFFSPANGQPQGTVVLDRQLVSRTMMNRPAVWFNKDGGIDIRTAKPHSQVVLEDGSLIRCQGVNETARRNRVTLFTSHFGLRSRTVPDGSRHELAINAGGRVVAIGNGNMEIPSGGFVLSGQGSAAHLLKRQIGEGQNLRLDHNLPPETQHALGGGPTLLQDGKVRVLAKQQHFRADVARGRAPRTAIGVTADRQILLVTIDGRLPGYSVGATLHELASTLKELGSVEALNLDGGGSTTMWLRGRTMGHPSDGGERPVSTALLVLPRRDPAPTASRADVQTLWANLTTR